MLVFPCGDGEICREIAAQVPLGLVVGVDPSDDLVRAARAALRDVDNVMFLCSDSGEIPWKDRFFSHALVAAGAESAEVRRVLADNGEMVCLPLPGGAIDSF